jgi:hypothetical protein
MADTHPMSDRCTATSKQRGERCKQPAITGGTVCRYHGGAAPQVKAAADKRLEELKPKAILTIDGLMDREEYPTVQLGAAARVIDWVDGKARESVAVAVSGSLSLETILRQRHERNSRR